MRTTEDLIIELDENAKAYVEAALIIGFEDTTIYVMASDPNRLQLLDDAVSNGGEPMGWYGVKNGTVDMGLLEEHAGEEWARNYLNALGDRLRALLDEHGAIGQG